MNYRYKINIVDEKEKWIFIGHDDWDESDPFVNLLRIIQKDCNGKIIEVGDMQYKVEGSNYDLVYQWDSCFGSVVIYNTKEQKEPVLEFLESYFDKLNV